MTVARSTTLPILAEPPSGPAYPSLSSISLFQACPLRYYFKYVAGLPEDTVAASLILGGAIHAAVQYHFERLLIGDSAPSLDTLLEVFWDTWHTHEEQMVRFNKGEDISTIGPLADRMLRAFQASDFARPTGKILAVAEDLRASLIPGMPDLLARVDLIVETHEALEIADFKTARAAWNQEHVADAADLLLLCGELVRPLADGKPLRLGFAVLTKTKNPDLAVHLLAVDPRQLERSKRIVERVWRAIEAGQFYPNPSPINCSACPYREPCCTWTG